MENNKYEKYISTLDTNRFGLKIAKLDYFDNNIDIILNKLKEKDVKLIISRINCNEIELLNKLEDKGFRFKDNQITYRYDIVNFNQNMMEPYKSFNIREVEEKDIPAILKYTEESFDGYGHYFANKRLDRKKCNEIYVDWAKRSCTDKNVADKVFVADIDGEPAGFVSYKTHRKGNSFYCTSGLGAVDKRFRNLSVFRAILMYGLQWGADIGLEWEEHNILTTNTSVIRTFSKLNFKIISSWITLHCWL